MKGKDIILLGAVAFGGYILYKMISGSGGTITGGGGGGIIDIPPIEWNIPEIPQITTPNIQNGTNNTVKKDVYFLDYGTVGGKLSPISSTEKRILIPAERVGKTSLVVPFVSRKWTPSFIQAIRTIFPPAIIQ